MQELEILAALTELGIAGIAIVIIAGLFLYMMKEHRKERDEWRKSDQKAREENNAVLKELTTVIRTINRDN